jgi:polysaccharide export outer membrane protein
MYIYVADCPEASRSYRLSATGELVIPLIKTPLQVAGLLPSAIEKKLADELVAEKVLVSPMVSVAVVEYRSRPVTVAGAVARPVTLQALGRVTLLDALAQAGGLTNVAGPEIVLKRSVSAPEERIPVQKLMSGAEPALNITLKGGEEIRVPEAGKIYVVGNVKSPGTYPVSDSEGSSVLKALAQSQGLLPFSRKEGFVYRAAPGTTDRKEIHIAVNDIMQRHAPDFPLLPNDILYIPDNSKKRMSAAVIDRITGLGGQTLSNFVLWGAR